MSHVVSLDMFVDDLDTLEKACAKLGLELKRDQKTYKWFGRWLNDYKNEDAAFKLGIKPEDYGKCEHAIGVKDNDQAYEVGLVKRADGKPGWQMVWDFFAGGYGLVEKIGKDANLLRQQYSVQQTLNKGISLNRQGFSTREHTDEKGRVHLVYTRGH